MPTPLPPIEHRFPVNRPYAPHTKKHPNGYLTCKLKRFLTKKIKYEDPETQKIIKGNVADALMWRLILNGTQGDNHAIAEILERIDGKLSNKNENGNGNTKEVIIIVRDGNQAQTVARQNDIQQEKVSSPILSLGDREINVPDLAGNVVQRANPK